jgi:hypothetical protein
MREKIAAARASGRLARARPFKRQMNAKIFLSHASKDQKAGGGMNERVCSFTSNFGCALCNRCHGELAYIRRLVYVHAPAATSLTSIATAGPTTREDGAVDPSLSPAAGMSSLWLWATSANCRPTMWARDGHLRSFQKRHVQFFTSAGTLPFRIAGTTAG